jgi:hypothetical protein
MRGADHRSSEFGPDWMYPRPSRVHARAVARRAPAQGNSLAWLLMLVCAIGVVWNCGALAFSSLDRVNQQLEYVLGLR